jgi:5-(carboxyamino)imidazole ribonucleotide mutase
MPLVGVVMGSKSDEAVMQSALDVLSSLGIEHEVSVISAHRNPEKAQQYARSARERGIEVIIAAAGMAAHLPGALASGELKGVDALYSIVQMPAGIPVACMAIGSPGAKNAAYLAAEILGLKHEKIRQAYEKYRVELQGTQ